jgi:hypothetical protein
MVYDIDQLPTDTSENQETIQDTIARVRGASLKKAIFDWGPMGMDSE